MEIIIRIAQFLLSLSLLVILHEAGHFAMARLFKTRVERFQVFFGRPLFHFRRGETDYRMGWIPLGGYVKISGMIDESLDTSQMKLPPQPYEFRSKPSWQRLLIMLGGVLVNFILAFIIYIGVLFTWGESFLPMESVEYGVVFEPLMQEAGFRNGDRIVAMDGRRVERFFNVIPDILLEDVQMVEIVREGVPMTIYLPEDFQKDLLGYSSQGFSQQSLMTPRLPYEGLIASFPEEGSPAVSAGLLTDDRILMVGAQHFRYYDEFSALISSHPGETIELTILRGADTLSLPVKVTADGKLGLFPSINYSFKMGVHKYGFFEAIPAGIEMGWEQLTSYLKQFKLFKNREALKSLGGFITIGSIFPGVWNWNAFWSLTALISMILAVMNLLPIPGLDGGHVLFLLVEMVTGRRLSDRAMEVAQIIGMLLILGLVVLANANDLVKLFF